MRLTVIITLLLALTPVANAANTGGGSAPAPAPVATPTPTPTPSPTPTQAAPTPTPAAVKRIRVEAILRDMAAANPVLFLEIAFGRVPNETKVTGDEEKPVTVKIIRASVAASHQ